MEERDSTKTLFFGSNGEIDFVNIVAKLWKSRWYIIKSTSISVVIGLFIAIFTPNVYTASTTMVPQIGEKRAGGGLSGIAAMAGIDLSSLSGGDILSPNIYPQILNNINFQKELIYSKFNTDKSTEPISYFDYVLNKKINVLTYYLLSKNILLDCHQ